MRSVVTIGEILVEIMATEPGAGFREPIALVGPFPSGAPAIFIDQVARLGRPAALIGAVGDDDFGRVNLDRLSADGVDVSAVAIDPDRPTGSAFVRYRPDGGRDFVFNLRHAACGALTLTPAAERVIAAAGHLHVMGSPLMAPGLAGLVREAVTRVKGAGGTLSFDPNLRKDMTGSGAELDWLLDRTDLFLPSGDELYLFGHSGDESAALAALLARGISAVVLKRGAAGSTWFDASGTISAPGFAVTEIDPTGAGDCFGAALVHGWLDGLPPAAALRLANAAGALAVTRRGPMEGAATRAGIEAFLSREARP